MKRSVGRQLVALTLLSLSPGISFGHHAFAAQYDETKPVELTGIVVKVEWLNPHAYFFIDVHDDDGSITTWACELTSPVGLMRLGWTRNSMAIGDVVVVEGILARDGSRTVNARSVMLTSTGQRLFTRSPDEEHTAGASSGR